MSIETMNSRLEEGLSGGGIEMLRFALCEDLASVEPFAEAYADELDCGTVRVRIRIEVEPTGLTPIQAEAAVVASDRAEPAEVRAAAAVVAAGGPGQDEALAVLRGTGFWPY